MIFQRDLSGLCEECKLDKKEMVKTALSFICMVAIISLMSWSIIDKYSTEPVPVYIDKEALKRATAEQLAQYTYQVNAEMERRAQK